MRKCGLDKTNKALLEWFNTQTDVGFLIKSLILKIQAENFLMQLEHKDYSCSNGWLEHFKNQHNIVYAQASGQALSADTKMANE
jgi:hypothetical protein